MQNTRTTTPLRHVSLPGESRARDDGQSDFGDTMIYDPSSLSSALLAPCSSSHAAADASFYYGGITGFRVTAQESVFGGPASHAPSCKCGECKTRANARDASEFAASSQFAASHAVTVMPASAADLPASPQGHGAADSVAIAFRGHCYPGTASQGTATPSSCSAPSVTATPGAALQVPVSPRSVTATSILSSAGHNFRHIAWYSCSTRVVTFRYIFATRRIAG